MARSIDNLYQTFHTKIDTVLSRNGVKTTGPAEEARANLTGLVDVSNGLYTVLGAGTKFTEELAVGDTIKIIATGQTRVVSVITSDTSLTVSVALSISATGSKFEGPANAAIVNEITDNAYQNQSIYVMIHKTTGIPKIAYAPDDSYYLVARTTATIGSGATDLDSISFEVENDLAGLNAVKENLASITRSMIGTGFLRPVQLTTGNTDNTIRLLSNVCHVLGYSIGFLDQDIPLGDPPTSGSRFDFVWLEIWREADPNIQVFSQIRIKNGLSSIYLDAPLSDTSVQSGADTPAAFLVSEKQGHFSSIDSANSVDQKRFAIPLAIVHRFNSASYSVSSPRNLNGGVDRPDSKSCIVINEDELLNIAPRITQEDKKSLLGQALRLMLKGELLNSFEQASYDSGGGTGVWSKRPYQIDYLGSFPTGSEIGKVDGARRNWSNNVDQLIDFSFKFRSDIELPSAPDGYLSAVATYNNVGNHLTLFPTILNDFDLYLDPSTGWPTATVKWVSDNTDVGFIDTWNVDADSGVADVQLDLGEHADGEIAVMFKAKYLAARGFTKVPTVLYSALRNDDDSDVSNFYAIAPATSSVPSFVKNEARTTTINAVEYTDTLYILRRGDANKFYANTWNYYKAGNGSSSTFYSIPIDLDPFTVIGLVDVIDDHGNRIVPTLVKWDSGNLKVKLPAMSTLRPIKFVLGRGGKQLDYKPGSKEITDLCIASYITTDWNTEDLMLVGSSAIKKYCSGNIIHGFNSLQNNYTVFIDNISVPVRVDGVGGNILTIDMRLSTAEHAALPSSEQRDLYTLTGGLYKPAADSVVSFSTLETFNEQESIVLRYSYSASPWRAFSDSSAANIEERGFLLITTDGPGNGGDSIYSPTSERFPVVQGISAVGTGTEVSPLGIHDVLDYQQNSSMFIEGCDINFDSEYQLSVYVQAPTGLAVWVALVKQGNRVLMFSYQNRDGHFVLDSIGQAFVAELKENIREVRD